MSQKVLSLKQVQLVESNIEENFLRGKGITPTQRTKKQIIKPQLAKNALQVITKRYLIKDRDLKPLETPEDMFHRVAKHIAQADSLYGASGEEIAQTENDFYEMMAKLEFLPNSPTFTGAGTKLGQLAACFVLPIEDDMKGILKTQMDMGLIHKSGGGTGFSFSRLRPKNDVVGSTGGISSGPTGFLQMYNDTTEVIKQGGTRRGANMGILRVDHPDILDFISYKEKEGALSNFNISVALTKEFMEALEKDKEYELVNPRDGKVTKKLKAREVFDKIVDGAWRNGEPGIIFLDKINEKNPTPEIGEIEATNPCVVGETFVSTEKGLMRIKDLAQNYANGGLKILVDEFTLKFRNINHSKATSTNRKCSLQKIKAAFRTGMKECYKIITESGYELVATANHKTLTNEGFKEVKDLKVGQDRIYLQPQAGFFNENRAIPFKVENLVKGQNGRKYQLNLPVLWSKELGEILGYTIGDGWIIDYGKNCRFGLTFGKDAKATLDYFKKTLDNFYGKNIKEIERIRGVWHLSYHSKYFVDFFKKLGIQSVKAEEKKVPESIFTAPTDVVTGFLSGLFSSDGTIRDSAKSSSDWIALTSKSKQLLQQVQILLLNLGIKSVLFDRSREPKRSFNYTNKNGDKKTYDSDGVLYELGIFGESLDRFEEKINFLQPQKRGRLKNIRAKKRRTQNFSETIKEIIILDKREVYNLTEPTTHSMIVNGIITRQCGEQPLLPYESCNLGAINLKKFVKTGKDGKMMVDWEKLERIIPLVVHFMDNVIDVNKYPLPEIEKMTKQNRKIGITVMGFADMLYLLNIPYDSEKGLTLAEKVMGFIEEHSHNVSAKLAQTRGEFPNFKGSIWDKIGAPKMRNAATTSCNPTGTLSIIGTCSSGIEPFFALAYTKTVMDNDALPEINEHFLKVAKEKGFYGNELMRKLSEKGSIQEIDSIPADTRRVFKVASDISPEWHVRMQAVFQKHTDGAISKTINFPNSATRKDVEHAYLLAYKLGCKGLTVYRDGSRNIQVLTTGANDKKKDNHESQTIVASPEIKITPRERPDIIRGFTYRIKTAYGKLFITINDDEHGAPFEVFSHLGKAGGFFAAKAEAICRLISLALRSGIDAHEVIDQLKGIRGPTPTWSEDGKMILSLPDAIAHILEKHINKSQANLDLEFKTADQPILETVAPEISQTLMSNGFSKNEPAKSLADFGDAPACQECGAMLEMSEGCLKCQACGFSKCG